jgi:hypothetical protein
MAMNILSNSVVSCCTLHSSFVRTAEQTVLVVSAVSVFADAAAAAA